MKCFHCKKIIPDNSKFCPLCGEEQGFSEELLERAQKGDPDAISVLYIRTYDCVYTTLKILIRDEETVLDLVQDTYLKGIQNLGQLREADKFRPWIKRIARNLGVDHLRKKKVVLFSQMEEDADAPVDFEDDRTASLPEEMLDQRETAPAYAGNPGGSQSRAESRGRDVLLRSDECAGDRRESGISENTVKSRLLYGRRKIEASVNTLEKQGTKLYGLLRFHFCCSCSRMWRPRRRVPSIRESCRRLRAESRLLQKVVLEWQRAQALAPEHLRARQELEQQERREK